MRRVVITGVGLVSPLACGAEATWKKLINSESGIRAIDEIDVSDLPVKIAGTIVRGEGEFNPDDWMPHRERRRADDFILYGMAAATQAVKDSGWEPDDEENRDRTGVLIGSGIGGLKWIEKSALAFQEKGVRGVSPFFIPAALINLVSGHVSIRFGFRGPNHSVVTACATGAHAIGDASRLIRYGDAEVMVAGGAEGSVCRLGIAGFHQARALSTHFNDNPPAASRPWDRDRDGFVMADGAGIVILEELEHARNRGAKIYGEVLGYGLSGDAYHVTAPAEDGSGGYRAMRAALNDAGLNTDDIDYINAHGTSTPLGDEVEVHAVKRLFGDHAYKLSMSSTKSAIGHLLGAAGSAEAIFAIKALQDQVAPPTLNLDNPSEGCDIDLVAHVAKERPIRHVLSNSFGFGGTNAALIFGPAP
jgi:3-oxoacyl-[acyl-carrier-protein] synthase II